MKRIAIGAVLVPCLLGWAQTAGVTLESQEKGLDAPLIATHEVTVRAEFEKGDLNGAVALLARTQPSREAARYGIIVGAIPGSARLGAPRPLGCDVEVRQSGSFQH